MKKWENGKKKGDDDEEKHESDGIGKRYVKPRLFRKKAVLDRMEPRR